MFYLCVFSLSDLQNFMNTDEHILLETLKLLLKLLKVCKFLCEFLAVSINYHNFTLFEEELQIHVIYFHEYL